MPASRRQIAAGNRYAMFGFLDEFGFLTGNTSSAPANGATGSGMGRLLGIKTASPTVPDPETEQVTGDDVLLGEFDFDSIATRRFNVDLAIQDLDAEAAMLGTTVETVGEALFGAIDIDDAPELDMAFIFQSRAKKQDSGVQGKAGWNGIIVPLATGKPLGRVAFEERTGATFRISVAPQIASYNPWGVTIQSSNAGTSGLRYRPFNTEYPIHIKRWSGDGAEDTFNLDFEPISVGKVAVYVNRVPATVSAIDTTNNTFTLAVAPAAGAKIVAVYEFTE